MWLEKAAKTFSARKEQRFSLMPTGGNQFSLARTARAALALCRVLEHIPKAFCADECSILLPLPALKVSRAARAKKIGNLNHQQAFAPKFRNGAAKVLTNAYIVFVSGFNEQTCRTFSAS
ncbi:MAG: hypothetical protein LBT59_28140 [Clostridiales bacterium]|nr:hypothetical protein [Clostridiales bacterium]